MSSTIEERLLDFLRQASYRPVKPKVLARQLSIGSEDYGEFRQTIKTMIRRGLIEIGNKNTVRLAQSRSRLLGVYRQTRKGDGWVTPRPGQGSPPGDIHIGQRFTSDAARGDVVLVEVIKPPRSTRAAEGRINEIVERASSHFVGTYFTTGHEGFVRVDGNAFHEPIYVGDPGAKGAKQGDKVVFEMLRFPSPDMTGEGVLTEVLGPRGAPGVDLLAVVRQFHLPDTFSSQALDEARAQARLFDEQPVDPNRVDLTGTTIVTIDPVDARDFDDAISLSRDDKGFWNLGVHIADVASFVPQGSVLDAEARERGTSVYLPGRVIPMLPELISNGLASLQEGKTRYVKSAFIEFDAEGRITNTRFSNSVIKVTRRFAYEQVMEFFESSDDLADSIPPEIRELLTHMRELAAIRRERRRRRGMLELSMPDCELQYDDEGRVVDAHYAPQDEAHQIIEEFMVTANEAVAQHLGDLNISILRRVHEKPDPLKLKAFAEFLRSLDIKIEEYQSRFELQRVLAEVKDRPERHAVNYALLRSLKEAVYSPDEEGHFALASDSYCHFTSPIRRYPDLVVHRLLQQLLETGKSGSDYSELVVLGEHCSFTERRAEKAERELVKIKLLSHLADRVGQEMDFVITGVEEFGLFAQGVVLPAEGLIHIRTLTDDFYQLDRATHSLVGMQRGQRYRLGDQVRGVIVNVDLEQRELDLRLAGNTSPRRRRTTSPKRSPKPLPKKGRGKGRKRK
ncbi:Ribonuclease R [Planctomycetes bacterium Pan216]|uniref:Ribonuclease R n=1 Tax=Kolteria novifilia TaxID=2527975 RepID=A0A518AY97_9BACT|nr:Ribonuclease R [Planctomycetes bacterium Pan216]